MEPIFAQNSSRPSLNGLTRDISVKESMFVYAEPDGTVLDARDISTIDASQRHMYMKKLLLRRLILEKGAREGVYSDAQALAFLLGRLEQAMEDYYILKKSNMEAREEAVQARLTAMQGSAQRAPRPILEAAAREVIEADRQRSRSRILLEVLSGATLEVREGVP